MSILNFSKNSIIQAKTLKLMLKQKVSANSFGLLQAFISFSKFPRISGIFRLKLSKLVVKLLTGSEPTTLATIKVLKISLCKVYAPKISQTLLAMDRLLLFCSEI